MYKLHLALIKQRNICFRTLNMTLSLLLKKTHSKVLWRQINNNDRWPNNVVGNYKLSFKPQLFIARTFISCLNLPQ